MNWRKSIAFSFLPLLAFLGFMLTGKKDETLTEKNRVIASINIKKEEQHTFKASPIKNRSLNQRRFNQNDLLRNRIPQSVESGFLKDHSVKLTKGYEFLTNVGAVTKKQYNPDMGEIVAEAQGFVFFKTNSPDRYNPVAISKTTNKLYPLSQILHIRGVTADLRSSVLGQGLQEYYYHPPLKLLSVKTESGQLMQVYHELKKQGLNVELEVLKPKHQTI